LAADRKCLARVHKQLRASACYIYLVNDSEFTQRDALFVVLIGVVDLPDNAGATV